MTKKEKLIWRLGKLPSTEELRELVKDKILTTDEAREILFSKESQEDRDVKSLESEIRFLRELVEKLSKGRTEIVETIRYIQPTYIQQGWYRPYEVWCSNSVLVDTSGSSTVTLSSDSGGSYGVTNTASNFSSINTF